MKSAYRSVMFYLGQKELEMQYKMNRIVAQCRQKCEAMQEKFTEKLEQVHTAYQKMAKRCQMMEQEIESLSKDKQELQEKFSEKSRQKRKLDEMYDQLRSEYESMKRSAIQPSNSFYPRNDPDLFSANMMDNRDPIRKDWSVYSPGTPGPREDIWPARQNSSNSGPFDIATGSPAKQPVIPVDGGNRRADARPAFGGGAANPSMTLRNLILSPIKRPQLSRYRLGVDGLLFDGHSCLGSFYLLVSFADLWRDSEVLKTIQEQFESQTLSLHQTLQQYMAMVDSRLDDLRSQIHGSSTTSGRALHPPNPISHSLEVHSSGTEISLVLHSMKMEVLKFDGSDPNRWVFRIEEFFDFHATLESLRLWIVSFHMEGRANLKHRFGASLYDDPQGNLFKLTQTTTVAEFQTAFEDLMNRVTGISEPLLISFFITRLKPDIRRELLFARPSSLIEAFALARAYEARAEEAK
ncbi:E3 ubiquitin-protein ligase CCNB1IP1-like [Citrus sinensis]|nr:E3 ubiquitin-protein ligase CCNB1IP1-like [Citrus sinensis]